MFVFIDGVYQCNRNRDDLDKLFLAAPGSSGVNFRVRQKEEQVGGGGWVGRPWRFEPLRLVSDDVKPPPGFDLDQPDLNHLGTIHIFVLRCQASVDPALGFEDGTLTPESGMEPVLDFEGTSPSYPC
ncbi:hypothetical protein KEM55_008804 [Ascosphaera atra]|nr:hypothetical protein KEM55_008804 [Ascosphaera atra]